MGVGTAIHHVFKQWWGGPGCAGLMTGSLCGLCRLSERIRLAAYGGMWSAGVTSLTSKEAWSLGHCV